jgi:GNAT superfamily N-acetyltransferase
VGRYEPDIAADATTGEIDRAIAGGTALAEVAFVVHEEYRGLGIAPHLLKSLAGEACLNGYSGLAARVSSGNTAMLRVFEKALGAPASRTAGAGEIVLHWQFEKAEQSTEVRSKSTGLEVPNQIRQNADVATSAATA